MNCLIKNKIMSVNLLTNAFLKQLQKLSEMGSKQSVLKDHGYELVSEQDKMILVKNEAGDQFVIKKLNANKAR